MNDFERLLSLLADGEVQFVVIGGVAMYANGSPHLTRDLDICYQRSPENIRRLVSALAPHRPRLRGAPADLPFIFDERTVTHGLNFTLTTELGSIDLLGEVQGLGDYGAVAGAARSMKVFGRECQILSLDGLIQSKRAAGRPRDLAVLPELEALRELERKVEVKSDGSGTDS